jgi:hypothetical protein
MARSSEHAGGLIALGSVGTQPNKKILERLEQAQLSALLPALRKQHSVPEELTAVEAWIWLGTVLAEKHPPPKKRGPKAPRRHKDHALETELILGIERVSIEYGVPFNEVFQRMMHIVELGGYLPEDEDPDTTRRRWQRNRAEILKRRAASKERLLAALLGQQFPQK